MPSLHINQVTGSNNSGSDGNPVKDPLTNIYHVYQVRAL